MEFHGIPHDFRLDNPSVKLVDGQENAGNDQDVLKIPPREPGQQHRRNKGADDAQIRDDAQHADRRADGDGIRQSDQFQADGDQDAFNDAHKHLTAEEGDQVAVDLLHRVHHVLPEFGGFQGKDAGPLFFNFISFQKEIKGKNGRDQNTHHDSYGTVQSASAGREPGHQFFLVEGGIDGHVGPQFFAGRLGVPQLLFFRFRVIAGIQLSEAGFVNTVYGAGDEGYFNSGINQFGSFVPEFHPVVDQFVRLPDKRRQDGGPESHHDGKRRSHDRNDGPGPGKPAAYQPGDDGFQQIGDDGRDQDGKKNGLQKAQHVHHLKNDEGGDAQHHQKGDARQGIPANPFLEGGRNSAGGWEMGGILMLLVHAACREKG